MAKAVKKAQRISKKSLVSPFNIYWDRTNYLLFLSGVICCIIGFYFMSIKPWDSTASLNIAPVILFIGYTILFPVAILFRRKNKDSQEMN